MHKVDCFALPLKTTGGRGELFSHLQTSRLKEEFSVIRGGVMYRNTAEISSPLNKMNCVPKCFLISAMLLCACLYHPAFGAGPNEVITESPEEADTSIQELHLPSAESTAQTTRETNFLRDLDTELKDSTTSPPPPTTMTILQRKFTTIAPPTSAPPPPATQTTNATEKFPKDLFSVEERRRGWVILHITGLIYIFVSLVIVMEEFFVPALGVITDILGLSSSVAGATIMAAACSVPRFLAFFIGVFLTNGKVRIDTMTGSAVFNILFVIGMCALFSREVLRLTWWPLFRDVSFYILDLILLIIFFLDNAIVWWESVILVGGYAVYVLFMTFNGKIERFFKGLVHKHKGTVIAMEEHGKDAAGEDRSEVASRNQDGSYKDVREPNPNLEDPVRSRVEMEEGNQPLSLQWPGTWCKRVKYLLLLPVVLPLWITLPDVRKQKSRKLFMITLLGSLLWMTVFLYLMTWWAHQVAETVLVPDHIMNVLSSRLSLPVLITAVIVARRGLAEMAVAVALGSNIFDITLGLPVPWLVYSAVYSLDPVAVSSSGLSCSITIFFFIVLTIVISSASCKWRMNKILGFTMVLLYLLLFLLGVMLKDHSVISTYCQGQQA